MASGLARNEAQRRARLEFGGREQLKEECRDARGVHLLETLMQGVRYGLRILRKKSGFCADGYIDARAWRWRERVRLQRRERDSAEGAPLSGRSLCASGSTPAVSPRGSIAFPRRSSKS